VFGISGTELLIIFLVTLLVFGPKELPKIMRNFGTFMRTINRMSGDLRNQLDEAIRAAEKEIDAEKIEKSPKVPHDEKPPLSGPETKAEPSQVSNDPKIDEKPGSAE
jgi:Tat protein translocase TatB subunit